MWSVSANVVSCVLSIAPTQTGYSSAPGVVQVVSYDTFSRKHEAHLVSSWTGDLECCFNLMSFSMVVDGVAGICSDEHTHHSPPPVPLVP